ncbi:unnamed protein product [Schistosoma mattheei]|uniref:Uncharacterized protein n=1 Tax=Schistosoma mattheei TaxID=31246 RepID=A0A183PJ07_9TREM|nr:unnamed protein product [Schistosoma mattheei]
MITEFIEVVTSMVVIYKRKTAIDKSSTVKNSSIFSTLKSNKTKTKNLTQSEGASQKENNIIDKLKIIPLNETIEVNKDDSTESINNKAQMMNDSTDTTMKNHNKDQVVDVYNQNRIVASISKESLTVSEMTVW